MTQPEYLLPVLACGLAGFATKYIDEVRDEHYLGGSFVHRATLACTLAITAGSLFPSARLFFASITIGCFFSRKLDIPEFKWLGLLALVASALWNATTLIQDNLLGLLSWSAIAYCDEQMNKVSNDLQNRFLKNLFYLKPLYVVGCGIGVVLGLVDTALLVCVIAFDSSYAAIALSKNWIKRIDPIKVRTSGTPV